MSASTVEIKTGAQTGNHLPGVTIAPSHARQPARVISGIAATRLMITSEVQRFEVVNQSGLILCSNWPPSYGEVRRRFTRIPLRGQVVGIATTDGEADCAYRRAVAQGPGFRPRLWSLKGKIVKSSEFFGGVGEYELLEHAEGRPSAVMSLVGHRRQPMAELGSIEPVCRP
jgi:hypothetical protein